MISDEHAPSPFAAIGLWDDSTVFLFKLTEGRLDQVSQTNVLGDVLSRSVLLTRMDRIIYLMVALGNGTLHYYQFNDHTGMLSEEKKATLGKHLWDCWISRVHMFLEMLECGDSFKELNIT
jgi:6-phosphogluconolactonase (cycloisomerase 2 family)